MHASYGPMDTGHCLSTYMASGHVRAPYAPACAQHVLKTKVRKTYVCGSKQVLASSLSPLPTMALSFCRRLLLSRSPVRAASSWLASACMAMRTGPRAAHWKTRFYALSGSVALCGSAAVASAEGPNTPSMVRRALCQHDGRADTVDSVGAVCVACTSPLRRACQRVDALCSSELGR